MACMVNTYTLVKDRDFGLKLESATPAVDRPVSGVDGREVDKMLLFHSDTMARSQLPRCSLLLALQEIQLTMKENQTKVIYSITTNAGKH
jgi:hypothetical protein